MKRPSLHRQRGNAFTLVELLVVIAIIAILASVVTVAASGAIKAAKRTKAKSICSQIQIAMQSYYTEYGVYPVVEGVTTDDYYDGISDGQKWQNLTDALCGNLDPYTGQAAPASPTGPSNTHNIAYLSPTRSDLDATHHTLQNPFGSTAPAPYFSMVVDTDYSNVTGDTGAPDGTAGPLYDFTNTTTLTLLGHGVPGGVAVWCSCDQPVSGAKSNPNFWAHTY
jgi:prepilin-type N-terminal cleavage/methylation domain-containing protein